MTPVCCGRVPAQAGFIDASRPSKCVPVPEGPQVARYARLQRAILGGKRVRIDSPDGRSADVATLLDRKTLGDVEAVGKHLLYDFGAGRYLHIHLGRFGGFDDGPMPLPEVRGVLRFRMYTSAHWVELRGAIAIDVYDASMRERLEARIGPNPLDSAADPMRAYAAVRISRAPIGLLLMDQSIVAGVGNIYRSEVLFLNRVHPRRPGTGIDRKTWRSIWTDLRRLMADGELAGRIVTTWPRDRERPDGAARGSDRFYVYHRADLPCRRCGTSIVQGVIATRNVYWCPHDQPEPAAAVAGAV